MSYRFMGILDVRKYLCSLIFDLKTPPRNFKSHTREFSGHFHSRSSLSLLVLSRIINNFFNSMFQMRASALLYINRISAHLLQLHFKEGEMRFYCVFLSTPHVTMPTLSVMEFPLMFNYEIIHSPYSWQNATMTSVQVQSQIALEPLPQTQTLPSNQEPEGNESRTTARRSTRKHVLEKNVESAKKNSQSNIINQLFAYYSNHDKSEKLLMKAINLLKESTTPPEKIKSIFYNIVRLINYKRGRKYVNRQTIRNYYTPEECQKHLPDIKEKLQESGLMTLEQFCFIFRVCTFHFLRETGISAILTSKRVSVIAKCDHFRRRRRIQQALMHSQA